MTMSFTAPANTVSSTELDLSTGSAYSNLLSQATTGWFQFQIDTTGLLPGDQYVFRVYTAKDATAAPLMAYEATVTGDQGSPLLIPPMLIGGKWTVTGMKLAGSDRMITLAVNRDDASGGGGGSTAVSIVSHPPQLFKLSDTTAARRRFFFTITLGGSRVTGLPGSNVKLRLSKQGGATAAALGTWVEVDATNMPGVYYYEATQAELNTAGLVVVYATPTGDGTFDDQESHGQVVSFDPFDSVRLGLTALPNAAANAANGLMTAGTGTNQINASGGAVDANITKLLGTAAETPDTPGRIMAQARVINAGAISSTTFSANAIDSNALATSAVTEIQTGLATATAVAAVPAAVWQYAIEGAYTAEQLMRGFASSLFGIANGFDGATRNFRDLANTKNRIVGATDSTGRTTVTLNLT